MIPLSRNFQALGFKSADSRMDSDFLNRPGYYFSMASAQARSMAWTVPALFAMVFHLIAVAGNLAQGTLVLVLGALAVFVLPSLAHVVSGQ